VTPTLSHLRKTEEARCASGGGTGDKSNLILENGQSATGTSTQFQASGGIWQCVYMMGALACVQPYADTNWTCRSGSDCSGQSCLQAAEALHSTQQQTGRCNANNPLLFRHQSGEWACAHRCGRLRATSCCIQCDSTCA